MTTYILRRLIQAFVVLWGAVTLLFFLIWIIPGDITSSVGDTAKAKSDLVLNNQRRLYGLDQPLYLQYLKSLKRLVTFDFGRSGQNRLISDMLKESLGSSARLTFWGVLTYSVAGILIGVFSAVRHNGFFDRFSGFFTILLNALPPFVMGIILQVTFSVIPYQWHWPKWTAFPPQWDQSAMHWFGLIPLGRSWKYLILPVITLASVETASNARQARAVMLEVLRADYLRTARAKGISERSVLFKHGLRNAMIPIITNLGTAIPNSFGYAVLTETVWNIPGLGGTITQAVGQQDTTTVLAFGSVIIVLTVFITLAVDISYGFIDPRVRLE